MDKIKRWNKLAVWVGENIIDADGKMSGRQTFEVFSIYNSKKTILQTVLNKMEEIEKEIPEPDEN